MNVFSPFSAAHGESPKAPTGAQVNGDLEKVAQLLEGVEGAGGNTAAFERIQQENQMAKAKLGVAHGMFAALRAKHSPTASHSLRVALGMSSWSSSLGMEDPYLTRLEVAALMHDIGKLGIPDAILTKPGKLSEHEQATVERCRLHSVDILRECCESQDVLDIVRFAGTWYDGTKGDAEKTRDRLPVGARMLSIVDAYDSMTTPQVYRHAMSTERALAELASFAGTQFDPKLVKGFCELIESNEIRLSRLISGRWLNQVDATPAATFWGLGRVASSSYVQSLDYLFQQQLVQSMHDGVVFMDHQKNILLWNRAMERLIGISATSVFQKQWLPSLVSLCDEKRKAIQDEDCPLLEVVLSSVPHAGRYYVKTRSGSHQLVEMHVHPVTNVESVNYGAVVIVRDLASELTLEEAIETLQEKATQDSLTKVANRAEFSRAHEALLCEHIEQNKPCSLIVSDLDFFKRVNDDYGHQAGDEVLMIYASILKRIRKQGDIVARYGGEEFVLFCSNCDGVEAAAIAEDVRLTLERTPIGVLDEKCCTASFGVTEIQPGDSPESMFRRADRALLKAKESGRNRVIQLGVGMTLEGIEPERRGGFLAWLQGKDQDPFAERQLVTSVPLVMAIEKLRGFLSDRNGQILRVDGNRVTLKVDGRAMGVQRRSGDRSVPFSVDVAFKEVDESMEDIPFEMRKGTRISIKIDPIRLRDRRRKDLNAQIDYLVAGLKSYFVAKDLQQHAQPPLERAVTAPGRRD